MASRTTKTFARLAAQPTLGPLISLVIAIRRLQAEGRIAIPGAYVMAGGSGENSWPVYYPISGMDAAGPAKLVNGGQIRSLEFWFYFRNSPQEIHISADNE